MVCHNRQNISVISNNSEVFTMFLILRKLFSSYDYFLNVASDQRMKSYPFLDSPLPMLCILAAYLYFVLRLGPKIMEKREPFNIKNIIVVFNIIQIVTCSFIVFQFVRLCMFVMNWKCQPVDYSDDPFALLQVRYGYLYFLIKVLDLLDTVFFIVRKKFSQVTFLHVYHHCGMVVCVWIGCKYVNGGHSFFIGFANCLVHAFMYLYYLLSIWDERVKKSLWWKKYITQLQILQFAFLLIIFGQVIVYNDCNYPKWIAVLFVPQNFFMFILFGDFYYKTYIKKKPLQQQVNDAEKNKPEPFSSGVMNGPNKEKLK